MSSKHKLSVYLTEDQADFVGTGQDMHLKVSASILLFTNHAVLEGARTTHASKKVMKQPVLMSAALNKANGLAQKYGVPVALVVRYAIQETIEKMHDLAQDQVKSVGSCQIAEMHAEVMDTLNSAKLNGLTS